MEIKVRVGEVTEDERASDQLPAYRAAAVLGFTNTNSVRQIAYKKRPSIKVPGRPGWYRLSEILRYREEQEAKRAERSRRKQGRGRTRQPRPTALAAT